MKNILLTVEYDGTGYHGWQRQKNALSIQQVIEQSIQKVTGAGVNLIGSSRTDAGVHALGQRANFNIRTHIPTNRIPFALNSYLPLDIRVIDAAEMHKKFHARYDALGKKYRYRIYNRRFPSALYRNYSCFIPAKLNITKMKEASKSMEGTKDFSAFCNSGSSVKSRVRSVKTVRLLINEPIIDIIIIADGFLYNMARIIAGTLVETGKGNILPGDVEYILRKKDRKYAGPTLPPQGLFLEEVYYPGILDTPGTM